MSHSNQSGLDRRDWIKVSAAGIAATTITGSTSAQSALAGPVNITKMSDPVPTRPLGRSGIPVSMLSCSSIRNLTIH